MINSFDTLGEKCDNQAICGKKCFFEISVVYSNIKLCYFDDFGFGVKSGLREILKINSVKIYKTIFTFFSTNFIITIIASIGNSQINLF